LILSQIVLSNISNYQYTIKKFFCQAQILKIWEISENCSIDRLELGISA